MTSFEAVGETGMIGINHVIPFCRSFWAEVLATWKNFAQAFGFFFLCGETKRDSLASWGKSESGRNSPSALIILMYNKACPTPLITIFLLHFSRPEPYLFIKRDLVCSAYLQLPLVTAG